MKFLRHWLLPLIVIVAFAGSSQANSLDYQTKTLSNGMKLVYKVLPDSPTVTVRFVVPAGFLTEPKELGGISHLLEHLIYRGNANYSKDNFNHQINDQGGSYNGSTWLDWTEFNANIPTEYFMGTLSMYADMLLHPGLAEENIALEKKIVTVEKAIRSLPGSIDWLYLGELTGERFNYHVQSFSRDDIVQYHQKYYRPGLITVMVTGAFNPDDVAKCLAGFKEDSKPAPLSKPQWLENFTPTDIMTEDYMQSGKYKLAYGFDLKQISGKDLAVAKILPDILNYENRNYDNITNRPLDYEISLYSFYDHYYLVFVYRDYQNEYSPEIIAWHQKNMDRYFKFLKNKNFSKFLDTYSNNMDRYLQSLNSDASQSNDYYFYSLFYPAMPNANDLSTIRNLNSGDFKNFVQKYLEGKPYHKIVIKAIQNKDGMK